MEFLLKGLVMVFSFLTFHCLVFRQSIIFPYKFLEAIVKELDSKQSLPSSYRNIQRIRNFR